MRNLPKQVMNLLNGTRFAYLCTVNRDSQPHIAPMFYVFHSDTTRLFLISSIHSRKVKNIMDNPKVALTIDKRNPVNPFENSGIMFRGTAAVISPKRIGEDPFVTKYGTVLKDFEKRYPNFEAAIKMIHEGRRHNHDESRIYRRKWFVLLEVELRHAVYWKGSVFLSLVLQPPPEECSPEPRGSAHYDVHDTSRTQESHHSPRD